MSKNAVTSNWMTWLQFKALYTSQLTVITCLKLRETYTDALGADFDVRKQLFQNTPMLCKARHTGHMVGVKKDYVREFEGLMWV